ncbi:hypothetical protein T11_5979 [Trichinella zimbabwensis]|uniref:Uncharacterized protein n=1 Tax=Trichinella zimbabwensis TaxID=268475 RepID=A0A0V1HXI2_9BILA|nr:hypothetical protein T11_5979 [Trichinella zimbabwensis]
MLNSFVNSTELSFNLSVAKNAPKLALKNHPSARRFLTTFSIFKLTYGHSLLAKKFNKVDAVNLLIYVLFGHVRLIIAICTKDVEVIIATWGSTLAATSADFSVFLPAANDAPFLNFFGIKIQHR